SGATSRPPSSFAGSARAGEARRPSRRQRPRTDSLTYGPFADSAATPKSESMRGIVRSMRTATLATLAAAFVLLGGAAVATAAGPPYPEPVPGQRVYDTAGVFS